MLGQFEDGRIASRFALREKSRAAERGATQYADLAQKRTPSGQIGRDEIFSGRLYPAGTRCDWL